MTAPATETPIERPIPTGETPARRELRVLWLADKLGYGDRMHGVGRYYLSVLPALQAVRGVEVVPAVLRVTEGLERQFAARGVALRNLRRGKLDPRTGFDLNRLIRRERVDILHLHGYGASTFGRLAASWTGKPAIVHQHDSVAGAPWYGKICDRWLAGRTARAIAVSTTVAEYCTRARSIKTDRITVLPNAVPVPIALAPERLRAWREGLGLPDASVLVGTVTRFREEKGVAHLISALPRVLEEHPRCRLLLWGDGELRPELESLVRELGLTERVHLLGYDPDAASYLAALDCFVLPSLSEGMPFALLEAMAAGRPIVATPVGGIPDVARDGEQLLFATPGDPEALAGAIVRILSDPDLATSLGRRAARVQDALGVAPYAAKLRELYEALACC